MRPFEPDQKIADMIRNIQSVQPPETFTDEVMKRLPDRYADRQPTTFSLSRLFSRGRRILGGNLPFDPETRECSYCYLITGSFYLIMAMVLMIGFKEKSSGFATMDWIRLQPQVTLGIAMWLFALGAALMRDGRKMVRMVRLGTLFYILFTMVNGILVRHYFTIPYGDIFLVGFVGGSAFLGILLASAVKKIELGLQS